MQEHVGIIRRERPGSAMAFLDNKESAKKNMQKRTAFPVQDHCAILRKNWHSG